MSSTDAAPPSVMVLPWYLALFALHFPGEIDGPAVTSRYRTAPRLRLAALLAAFVAALAAGGCSSSLVDSVPTWAGGESPDTPARPATPPQYPPVNDRPPARATKLISEEEEAKLEHQLTAARDNQAAQAKKLKKDDGQADTSQSASGKTKAAQEKNKHHNPPPN